DWAHEVPESPDCANGDCVLLMSPPSPPSAERLAMESPPVTAPPLTRLLRPVTFARERASPARSERTVAPSPPRPPNPPAALLRTALAAKPVSPEVAVASLAAPLLAKLSAEPEAWAEPVSPVLVAEDCAMAAPESPETAVGLCVIFTSPPSPPLAERLAMESPPVTFGPPFLERARASPALPEWAEARSPPLPPSPPTPMPNTALATSPVVPDTEVARDAAPELAALVASPVMWASPVVPESPELPDVAEPAAMAVPLLPVLIAPAGSLTS